VCDRWRAIPNAPRISAGWGTCRSKPYSCPRSQVASGGSVIDQSAPQPGREETIMSRRSVHISTLTAVGLLASLADATAQVFPARPITMVVPFAAGGPTDTLARIVGGRMRGALGQPVIIENTTGAGGSIAVGRVVRSAPDGHTIGIGVWNTHVLNGAIYPLQYDMLNDLEPVGLLANNYTIVVSKSAVPAGNLKELIAWMKANGDKVSAGTAGAGASTHVAGVLFQNLTSTKFQFVPYRGAAPAQQDLVGGQIDLMFDQASSALQHVRSGKIKAYAIASAKRSPAAPDIPTADESGLPGFHISVWHAIWAPKNTPKDIVAKLNAAVVETLADPAVQKRLADMGQELFPRQQQTPQALGAFHRAEVDKWWPIVKAANIKPD